MKKMMILTVIALAAIGCCKKADGKCCKGEGEGCKEAAAVEEVVVEEVAADSTAEVVEVVEVAE